MLFMHVIVTVCNINVVFLRHGVFMFSAVKRQNEACLAGIKDSEMERRALVCCQVDMEV